MAIPSTYHRLRPNLQLLNCKNAPPEIRVQQMIYETTSELRRANLKETNPGSKGIDESVSVIVAISISQASEDTSTPTYLASTPRRKAAVARHQQLALVPQSRCTPR